MAPTALAFALAAAALHASWNLMVRAREDTEASTAVAVVVMVLAILPIAVFTWDLDAGVWRYLVPSAVLELAYVALLGAAYRRYELSVVYPVARGLAPVAALAIAVVAAGARPGRWEIGGVVLVAVGILLVRGAAGGRGVALGLVIAAAIGGYTVLDRYGIRHADPASYLVVVMTLSALAYPPLVGLRRVRAALSRTTALVGVFSAAAYLLVLLALRHASAPSVSAVRETSVVMAALLAALFLHERVGPARFAGAALVAAGVALLALA
jgi:drug/metabolite transporter (DMT)-like permease